MNNIFDFKLFGTYRTTLMGIAIIGVFIAHWLHSSNIACNSVLYNSLYFFTKLAFTPAFLFLSGYGLYYSMEKEPSWISFYKKRILRLYIPYVLISFPLLLLLNRLNHNGVLDLFEEITTLKYWISGNFYGMWYVSLSVLLYLFYPIIHVVLTSFRTEHIQYILFFVFVCISLELLKKNNLDYYNLVIHTVTQVPAFVLGVYSASLSKKKETRNIVGNMIYIILLLCSLYLKQANPSYFSILSRVTIYMPMICVFFSLMSDYYAIKALKKLLDWFGKYTLELYILHLLLYNIFISLDCLHISELYKITLAEIIAIMLCSNVKKQIYRSIEFLSVKK
ncbi:MAG: acyltransferase [Bacteroidales bacterium]|nr:acyltransferase [Bacteroidales bacterium]MCM1146224.1 acyltransferase [Bacteroidales bacterium]MCM1205338.1 acyltransferase [Bacillota bacterium]MCM1509575.1 acyltransferase [Clostridium sp.]